VVSKIAYLVFLNIISQFRRGSEKWITSNMNTINTANQSIYGQIKFSWIVFQIFFRIKNSQTHLWYLWEVIEASLYIVIFSILKRDGFIEFQDSHMPTVLFIAIGVIGYSIFSESLISSANSINDYSFAGKHFPINPTTLATSSVISNGVFFCLKIVVLAIVLWAYDLVTLATAMVTLLWLFSLMIFGSSIGLFLASTCSMMPDISRALRVFLRLGMFGSGAIFPIPAFENFLVILHYNPIAIALNKIRQQTLTSDLPNMFSTLIVILVVICFFSLALLFYRFVYRSTLDGLA
jgi:ABC-type polysaccharide/polyol phosphate export permease